MENPEHAESGCVLLTVNKREVEGNFIPEDLLTEETDIVLKMS